MRTTPPNHISLAGLRASGGRAFMPARGGNARARTMLGVSSRGLVVAWVTLVALLLWHGPGASTQSAAAQPPDEDGYLLIAGVYLPPPYVVSVDSAASL
jgi:hypothetical protein